MKQALEATEVLKSLFRQAEARHAGLFPSPNVVCQITVEDLRKGLYAADTLRTSIEQAEKQEPVMIYHGGRTIDCGEHGHHNMEMLKMIPAGSKLYTTPPAAQRQPLTDEEIRQTADQRGIVIVGEAMIAFARAIEAAHGIKENT